MGECLVGEQSAESLWTERKRERQVRWQTRIKP